MKKIFIKKAIAFMTVLVSLIFCLTAYAVGDILSEAIEETIGYVIFAGGGEVFISGEVITGGGLPEVSLLLGDAPVYDLLTGLPLCESDIKPGMGIRAAYFMPCEDGLAPAVAVWMNWDYDEAAVFTVVVSENIRHGFDGAVFLSADGKYRVALTPETVILDYNHKKLIPADILPGMEFFVWVDMITASNPSLVYPEKIVVIE